MTTLPPCGDPSCPVASPTTDLTDQVSPYVLSARTEMARGHGLAHDGGALTAAGVAGDGRFSPLPGVAHAYLAGHVTCALLETAFRDIAAPPRTVHRPALARWGVARVTTTADLTLADLRDPELERIGIDRGSLVGASPRHYPCTRQSARELHAAGHDGIIWHSRQADLHRDHVPARGLAATLLDHRPVEVTVVWSPPAPASPLVQHGDSTPLVQPNGAPSRLVLDWANMLGVTIQW